jgi:hypothetical protein
MNSGARILDPAWAESGIRPEKTSGRPDPASPETNGATTRRSNGMGNNLDALTTIFTEFYYWVTVVFMFLIHVGFCMYEVAASRRRNHIHTLMKNTMVIPLVTVTFFFFG